MKKTIFTTPILSFVLRQISNLIMFLSGWRVKGKLPNIPKYVLIGAPHTSNWDFVLFLGAIFYLKVDVRYMGKAELFRFPYGWFFYYCGGVPVDRKKSTGLVEQMIEAANKADKFILTIAPEGTRHKVTEWKSGFHRIAKGANIPIVMAKVDSIKKTLHVGEIFHPTENMDADMVQIQEAFKGFVGINPKKKYITLER
ncbi:MAG: phospholipid/glycerol acyltransferase [Chloroflexi bacterium OLB14]|nr:MAG: phospholipid/glycerol acyltransferase [Chloroflexi bacterium OLB14]